MKSAQEQLELLRRGTTAITPLDEFTKKLEKKTPLTIKLGADPTAPDLHLGHTVVLSKLRQFQDLGHNVVFLIGDYTARIGDPTGKSKTRPPLTEEEISQNASTYIDQVSRILDPKKTRIAYNSEWLSELNFADILKLCARVTVARLVEREDFKTRLEQQRPLSLHELLYPLMQGYDSVALTADIELGGTDQTFNLLMGRHLQEHYDQEPQVIMTFPLLEGLDGVQKMSKSLGNHIGLTETATVAFGKLMSLSDALILRYAQLLLYVSENDCKDITEQIKAEKLHPMDVKKDFAQQIIARFWSTQDAESARKSFEQVFQKRDYSQAPELEVASSLWIVDLLRQANAVSSSSEARRLIEAGAVSIDGEKISDFNATLEIKTGTILKVGKKLMFSLITK